MIVNPVIVQQPLEPVLSLSEAKQHLRLLHTNDDDDYVADLVLAAQEYITKRTERTFTQTTYEAVLPSFPNDPTIWLAYPPVTNCSIQYYSGTGTITDFDDFTLISRDNESFIECDVTVGWPVPAIRPDAVTITYTAGKSVSEVPAACRHAVRLLIGNWYANRESTIATASRLEHALESLCQVMKTGRVGGGYQ